MAETGIKHVIFGWRTSVFLWIISVGKARERVFYSYLSTASQFYPQPTTKGSCPQPVKYPQPCNDTVLHRRIIPLLYTIAPSRHVTVQPPNTVNNIIYQYIYIFGISGTGGFLRCL
jgi:hypothetical protein